MEVKPSYKQTEVGEIPKEWEAKTLSSLTTLLTNGFVGTATSAYVESEDGVLYIQGYNVKENGFNFHGIKRVSRAFHARNQKSCLQPGDLLTIQTGDIGITTVVPPELAGANCHALIISRLNKRASEPGFYCHYFNSERGRIAFKEIETGSTMKHLNCGDVKRLILPSPPIEEQRAIATALGDADALLRGLDALIAKKRDLKQAAMQQLLTGQMRLPGFQGEWEVKRLEHLADIFSGSTPKTTEPSFWDGGVKWCTPTDITSCPGKFLLETERTISSLGLASCAARLLPAGSLLLCSRATIGEIRIAGCEVCTNQGFKSLVCREGVNNEFLYYKLLTMKQQMIERAIGSTFLEISKRETAALEVPTPDLAEQTAIAGVLTEMDEELKALEQRHEKTRALKQAMMQELLTGKTRLV